MIAYSSTTHWQDWHLLLPILIPLGFFTLLFLVSFHERRLTRFMTCQSRVENPCYMKSPRKFVSFCTATRHYLTIQYKTPDDTTTSSTAVPQPDLEEG